MIVGSPSRNSGNGDGGSAVAVTVSTNLGHAALQEWDRFVDSVPDSDVAQLSAWARIRYEAGYRPLYLLARQDGQVVGGALALERRLPVLGSMRWLHGIVRNLEHHAGPSSRAGAATLSIFRFVSWVLFAVLPYLSSSLFSLVTWCVCPAKSGLALARSST